MSSMTLQQILDTNGFIVIAYLNSDELACDDARGYALADSVVGELSLCGIDRLPIVGAATKSDWVLQEAQSGDTLKDCEYIAYRKVVVE